MVQCRLVIVKDNIFQGTVKSMKQKAPGPLKVQAAVDEFEALNTSEQIDWMIHTAKHYPKLLAAVMEKHHKAALRAERGRRRWGMGLGPTRSCCALHAGGALSSLLSHLLPAVA